MLAEEDAGDGPAWLGQGPKESEVEGKKAKRKRMRGGGRREKDEPNSGMLVSVMSWEVSG